MAGSLPMGQTEPVSGNVMELVKRGQIHDLRGCQGTESKLSAGEANLRGLCARGGQRAYPRECGETGEPEAIRERALNAYRERYGDCGPTCAAEKPAGAEGIRIREDTLRRGLIAAGRLLPYDDERRRDHYPVRPMLRGGAKGTRDGGMVIRDKELRNTSGPVLRP